jgi:hypothetical protein
MLCYNPTILPIRVPIIKGDIRMSTKRKIQNLSFLLAVAMIGLLLFAGASLAQSSLPATEPDGAPAGEVAWSYNSAEPSLNALPPDENPGVGVTGSTAVFSYYQVSGATLRGRSSSTQHVYTSAGCSYVSVGTATGRILNTELPIPDGSVIKYLRVYYNDTNPSSGVKGYLTRYTPGSATNDLVITGSSAAFASGFGYAVSTELSEVVNNASYAYTLIGWPDASDIKNQICGLRVAYYAPFQANLFMPLMKR